MIRRLLVVTTLLLFLAPVGWAEAQQAKPQKPTSSQAKPKASTAQKKRLYRWVDAQGQVQYTDSLPESALQQGRSELSTKTGQTVKQVDRARTAEELHEAQVAADLLAQQQVEAAAREKDKRVLLASYPDAASIQRSFQQQRESLQARLVSSQALLAEQHRSLLEILEVAADLELKGTVIKPTLTAKVQKAAQEVRAIRASIALSKQDLQANEKLEADTLAAWKLAQPPATASQANEPVPTTP